MSPASPKFVRVYFQLVLKSVYQLFSDGLNTEKSAFPSPSKSNRVTFLYGATFNRARPALVVDSSSEKSPPTRAFPEPPSTTARTRPSELRGKNKGSTEPLGVNRTIPLRAFEPTM